MNLLRWLGLVAASTMFVCSCGGDGGAPAAETDGLGTVTRDSDAGASEPGVAYVVTVTMSSFTVPPNSEAWKCQDFANPFGGEQVDITTWDFDMTPGSHHMTLFNQPGATDGPLVDCPNGPSKPTSYSFGAQSAKSEYKYPQGIGEAIPAGTGFTVNSHYVNTTAEPIHAVVVIRMFVASPGVVTQHAGGYEGVLLSISVPPTKGQPVTVGSSCTIPQDMNLLAAAGHMHDHGSHFIATSGGKTLIETDDTASLPNTFSPPMQLKAGADITWSCDYTNETDAPLIYGPSALTNVMCNTVLAFYPIKDVNNPLLSCFH